MIQNSECCALTDLGDACKYCVLKPIKGKYDAAATLEEAVNEIRVRGHPPDSIEPPAGDKKLF